MTGMADNKNKKTEQPTEKKMTKYDLKMQRRKEAEARQKRNALIAKCVGIAAAVIVVIVIAGSIYNDYAKKHGDYLAAGNHSIKREEYDFYYNLCRNNTLNTYGSYLSYMGLDTSQDIDSQMYSSDMTWGDYFAQQAAQTIQSTYALNDRAAEAGFTYDAAEECRKLEDGLNAAAAEANTNIDTYVQMAYGDYATMDKVKTYYAQYVSSVKYQQQVSDGIEVTEDEIDAYYAENADTYDLADYRIFTVKANIPQEIESDTEEETEELTEEEKEAQEAEEAAIKEEAMAEAKAQADEFLSAVKNEQSFISQCQAYDESGSYEDEDASLKTGASKSSISPSAVADWLFEAGRAAGDTTVIEDTSSDAYHVVYYLDRYKDESATVNLRQIIVSGEDDVEDTEDTEALAAASLAKGQKILDEWEAGEKTEDSFAALADAYSIDTSAPGGLREGAAKTSYTDEINEWLQDSSRKAGEAAVIPYYNYAYVLYYIGEGLPKWQADITSALESDKLSDYMTESKAAYPIKDIRANLVYLETEAETETQAAETESAAQSESQTE